MTDGDNDLRVLKYLAMAGVVAIAAGIVFGTIGAAYLVAFLAHRLFSQVL